MAAGEEPEVVPADRIVFPDGGGWDLAARTHLLAVLNVTPDSFSDGGLTLDEGLAAARAAEMTAEGADAIDIGGESTRPGAPSVPPEEERRRVLPVLRRVRRENPKVRISVDTTRAGLAREAIEEGADMINDISGMTFDPEMPAVVARAGAACILMHIRGTPRTMQRDTVYDDLLGEIRAFLTTALARARGAGVREEGIAIDPGIGFGKTMGQNLEILRRLPELVPIGRPIVAGVSRKSFIGAVLDLPAGERLEGSLGAGAAAVLGGARLLRAHDVRPTVRMLRVVDAIARA